MKGIIYSETELDKIVDSKNSVIGKAPRKQMRDENLYHRNTHVILYNSQQQFFIQLRSPHKDYAPSSYSLATGGVVEDQEDEQKSAIRELKEEMKITAVTLKFHGILAYDTDVEGKLNRGFNYVYSAKYDGPIPNEIQKTEVEAVLLWDRKEIETRIACKTKIVPDTIDSFRKVITDLAW